MLFRVDPASPVPLGDQIAACVRGAVAEGTAGPGDRLPPARELAGSLGVNMHTVLRGYQKLREEGLIELRRGRGAAVAGGASPGRARLARAARQVAEEGRALGMADEAILGLVRAALAAKGPPPLPGPGDGRP
ncbi:GntR family transcriptional regulator [Streptomyces aidingensis]|uniref:DNA-binding transcriptional regulator YhcF, GntR family n=1 Tax=Streptomyces aidingensis TaxID=910347 RepID=A0A1I1IRX5_9ACTN|nr:GntR family transcriptional regulator [Streptomyces aidingensis]SFC36493.1 DNA-binding transcriptional regulator YhcF, GntR family [Streptomyces aidingensis]